MTTLDPRALTEELVASLEELNDHIGDDLNDSRSKRIEELRVALSQPQAGEPAGAPPCWWVDHGSYGQITQREDEATRALADGKKVVRYTSSFASPQPANPAQVTGEPETLRKWREDQLNRVRDGSFLTAAIGASGQAVAFPRPDEVSMASGTIYLDYADEDERAIAFDWLEAHGAGSALSQPHPADERVVEALPNWAGWRSIDTALEDCRVILATAGNWVGEAIMLRDEDTGEQVWTWVDTGKRVRHSCYGWMPLPEHIDAPVLSDLRPDGSDGPTGAE